MTEPLSVVVITRDAEAELPVCLASVTFADEILIVDSGSTDGTLGIARGFGARVLKQEWLGYGPQKQYGAAQARHRWVLSIDADEHISERLRTSIEAALRSPAHAAYAMARCNRFMGRWLRHGEGYPDWTVRLFDRERARWSDDSVHERVLARGSVGRLDGDLLHESEAGLTAYLEKQNRYTTLQAQALYASGKRAGTPRLALSPLFRFIKFYLLRLGFLDGVPGLVHISIGCFNSFVKYAKLRELCAVTGESRSPDRRGSPPSLDVAAEIRRKRPRR
jgi:glycosyltransferase involved in cell wall biosynthesis